MNCDYEYVLTPSALADIDAIIEYISVKLCAKESALELLNAIEKAIQDACKSPCAAAALNDTLLRKKGY